MKHFLRLLFLSPALAAAPLSAAVTFSGIQNVPIPTTFDGVSMTLNRTDASVFSTDTSSTNTDGSAWDINFFLGGTGIANSPAAQPVREDLTSLSFVHNLALNTSVDSGSTFSSGNGGSGFPNDHIGGGSNQFSNGVSGYLGFVLDAGTASPLYGWMKVSLVNDGTPGLIESWAFETIPNTPILVGATVPEPDVTLLLFAGAGVGLFRRRRR